MSETVEFHGPLPNVEQTMLPTRACLLSVRDELAPARRLALTDAITFAKKKPRNHEEKSMAVLECLWEASNCLELAANIGAPWLEIDAKTQCGIWPHLTEYRSHRATRFYQSSKNWAEERFLALSAHSFRVDGTFERFIDHLNTMGTLPDQVISAFEEAQKATADLLRSRFRYLADAWDKLRVYANGYEHGLLSIPETVGKVRDADGIEVPHLLLVWRIGKDEVHGESSESADGALKLALDAGEMALDLADYVADVRLRVAELIEFQDGVPHLKEWETPFPFWVSKGALEPETIQILNSAKIAWIQESDSPTNHSN